MNKAIIELKNINKSFGPKVLFTDLNLTVYEGEFLTVIGRSGVGKSVLLKQVIGLLKPDTGQIFIDNEDITKISGRALQKVFEKCGYVFQFAALLDSLTVFENVGITLLENGESEDTVLPLVSQKLLDVGLGLENLSKYPSELSGGMKKRVGLARTLMLQPKIILYDEPTTGLDPISVRLIHELIKETQMKFKITTLVISHDVQIFDYADRVAMLNDGKIIYEGPSSSIWENKNPYVKQFIHGNIEGPIVMPTTAQ
ncbi:MAG TPA: ATP-binding cassette domain-containing protein [Candidatus Babeliales bacterium]|nr:ATP-binding cassette domain-containing protein [Candidatus Babeliales bacterium]